MKYPILLALLATAAPVFATTFTGTVSGDTYIRNDGNAATNWNDDTDNEVLIGNNNGLANLRALQKFNVSSIINDVNTIGGGNFANLTINSASLQVFERRGRANTVNFIVKSYGFAFDPATSTWNAPATGDTTAGGAQGTTLGTQSVTWDATADSQDATITLSPADVQTAIANHLSNSLNLMITSDTATLNFLSVTSDRSATTARHAKLTVDYTVAPAGGPEFTLSVSSPHPDYVFPYSQTTATSTRTLRYTNTSASSPITVDAVNITNSAGGVFTLGAVSPTLPATLAAGQSIDIPVTAASAASGSFAGSIFIDTNATGLDKTHALTASFYQSGQLFSANPSLLANGNSWDGGSTWVTPGLLGFAGDGMNRVRGTGDPLTTAARSAVAQATTIPNNLSNWCLDFRFTPVAAAAFDDYSGIPADGNFTDRTFQLVVQSNDTVPAPGLTTALDDNTILNIAYMPDGITTGGVAGFYTFHQGVWELIDFNGDGSALLLDGSVDLDDASSTGIGNGALDVATGDTVNVYRMTIKGTGFGSPSASYSITLRGPGGLLKTATGLTAYHNQNITTSLPASFAFITTDASTESNANNGVCPSFWVDEIGYFAVDRPDKRLLVLNSPTILRSLNGATVNHTVTAFNDGIGSVDFSANLTGSAAVSITAPATFPVSLASGTSASIVLGFNPASMVSPNTADAGILNLTSNDPLLASIAYPYNLTKVTDANFAANGDFETVTANAPFPAGWALTGAPTGVTTILPTVGGLTSASLAPGQGSLQDFAPTPANGLEDFQVDFAFSIGNETQAHRIRLEGDNGADMLTIRLTTSPTATDSIDVFGGTFAVALSGLTINPNTPYFLRVIGRDFGLAGRKYKVGFSTDGVNYTTSGNLTAFHATASVRLETVTFECGATAGSALSVENVVVKLAPPNDLAAWMSGFSFAPGADLTPTGDADSDGIANVVENVLGTAPNVATQGLVQIAATAGSISFLHPLNADLASDVTYTYQWSTDLSEWKASGQANAGGVNATITPSAPAAGVVTVTTNITAGSSSKVFVRLVAMQQ